MRARKFIASLVLSAALAVGALPSAAFANVGHVRFGFG